MKLSESITLRFKYNAAVILVDVSLIRGLTWGFVAQEVVRLHTLSVNGAVRSNCHKHFNVSRIVAPNKEILDLSKRILYYDVASLWTGIFLLQVDGPWCMMSDAHLLKVYEYLDCIADLNAMMRVSRRFKKLFSSDAVWENIPFTFCVWQGAGTDGSEAADWQKIHEDSGLSIAASYRLRWISHHSSRLKLYYGSLPDAIKSGFFAAFAQSSSSTSATARRELRSTITVLGATDAKGSMKLFMRRLHYIVPESATHFHLTRECKPLLDRGMLLDLEPSPLDSRSRNLLRDPDTRIECCVTDPRFTFRRLGDKRLTFLGIEYDTERPCGACMPFGQFYQLTDKALGNVLLLDYRENDLEGMSRRLETLWDKLQYEYGANSSANAADWAQHKDQRYASADTPVLLYLAIDYSSWVPLHSDARTYAQKLRQSTGQAHPLQVGIQRCVEVVHGLLTRLSTAGFAVRRPRSWYIQPVDSSCAETKLTAGFFAGINWLLRAIATREEQKL